MSQWFTEKHSDTVQFSIEVESHLYHGQSPFQTIDVYQSKEFGRFFALDGYLMITEKDEFIYHDMIVHVPMATNPAIKKVLVIGAGDGGTVGQLVRYPGIQTIDVIEIDQLVVTVCQEFFPNLTKSFEDPRVNLMFQDGIQFINETTKLYDLIIIDSTDPIGPGEGLFTKNFYEACYHHLSEEGILVNQHESPFYDFFRHSMLRAHQHLRNTFPIAKVYQVHIPTYASGHWLFGFASKKYDPVQDLQLEAWNSLNLKTKYYNVKLHQACFALPNYVLDLLND